MQVTAENIRNVIADGLVTVSLSEDLECQSILPSDNCSVVLVNLLLFSVHRQSCLWSEGARCCGLYTGTMHMACLAGLGLGEWNPY